MDELLTCFEGALQHQPGPAAQVPCEIDLRQAAVHLHRAMSLSPHPAQQRRLERDLQHAGQGVDGASSRSRGGDCGGGVSAQVHHLVQACQGSQLQERSRDTSHLPNEWIWCDITGFYRCALVEKLGDAENGANAHFWEKIKERHA